MRNVIIYINILIRSTYETYESYESCESYSVRVRSYLILYALGRNIYENASRRRRIYMQKINYNLNLIGGSRRRRDSPAGRVVRRAGSSSRRSGAWRRAAAGPAGASASSASSSSAGSMALPALPSVSQRRRAHYLGRALLRSGGRVGGRGRGRRVQRVSYTSELSDGRARLRRARSDFPARAREGAGAPLAENAA